MTGVARNEELIPVRRVQCPLGYTEEYVARLYERVAHELKERLPGSRDTLLGNASLTVPYVIRHMVNTLFKEVARVLEERTSYVFGCLLGSQWS